MQTSFVALLAGVALTVGCAVAPTPPPAGFGTPDQSSSSGSTAGAGGSANTGGSGGSSIPGTGSGSAVGILPPDRRIDWAAVGVPGGIPSRATCQTIPAGASASTIQAALDSAACQSKAVLLSPGKYTISGGLQIPSNVTLRGAGPQATILTAGGKGDGFLRFGPGVTPVAGSSTVISAGASAGSQSATLASVSGVTVGSYLLVTQLNDSSYVTITTSNGSCTWCDGGIGWNGTRAQGQIVEVTAVDPTTGNVTFSPPLYVDYSSSPLATPFVAGAVHAGVEDLQVAMTNSGFTANMLLAGAAYSWIKNVESNYADGDHVQVHWGFRNEIRDSYFHDAYLHSPGSTDSDIFIADKSTGNLIENNALRRLHVSIMLNWGAAGNVVAYNYADNNFDSAGVNLLFGGLSTHGAHPMFNLWEGNIVSQLNSDYFWGSSSHNTAFRNWFRGAEQIIPPLTGTGPEEPQNAYWTTYGLVCVDLSQTTRYDNLVGNVVGSDHLAGPSVQWTPEIVVPSSRAYYTKDNGYGYAFGYANTPDDGSADGDSDLAYTTAILHGGYDFVAKSFTWDSSIATHALPASFYRSSKPAWFGDLAWPSFGPDPANPSAALVGTNPAKQCREQGKMPSCLE